MIRRRELWIAATAAAVLAGCSTMVRPDDPVYIRQQQLEARVDRLDQVLSNHSLVNLSGRLDNLQAQVNALRGDVQVLQHDQALTDRQQRDLYSDLDKRLRKLELSLTAAPTVSPDAGTAASPVAVTGSAESGDQAAYQRDFNRLKQGRYADAITHFTDFIQQYPQSPLVPNAEFWMGEAHYQMGDFTGALINYHAVLQGYPSSNKAPDALLKIGYVQYELKQYASARKTLNRVIKLYPGTSVARLARERLARMRQEGH